MHILPWFFFLSSAETPSSFFGARRSRIGEIAVSEAVGPRSGSPGTGPLLAKFVPDFQCIFKPAVFLHVRAAVHNSNTTVD